MLIVIDDRSVMARFSRVLLHEKVYRISNFLVRLNHKLDETKYHLNLTHTSVVERVEAQMPEHCWDLVTVPHVITGLADTSGLVGIIYSAVFFRINNLFRGVDCIFRAWSY